MMPVSVDFVARLDALRQEFIRETPAGTAFFFEFSEEQALDLASGFVPATAKAAFMAALDWNEEDRRRASRPAKEMGRR